MNTPNMEMLGFHGSENADCGFVTPCILVGGYQYFGETSLIHLPTKHSWLPTKLHVVKTRSPQFTSIYKFQNYRIISVVLLK
jgi:hypothetical protein